MQDISQLENKIGMEFKNKDLLLQALTHRSYLNENPKWGQDHNERLEFLGDAVLELITTEYLFRNFPNPEGDLTSFEGFNVTTKGKKSKYELAQNYKPNADRKESTISDAVLNALDRQLVKYQEHLVINWSDTDLHHFLNKVKDM